MAKQHYWIKYRVEETLATNCPLALRLYYKYNSEVAYYMGY